MRLLPLYVHACAQADAAWKPETSHVYPISEGEKMHAKRAISLPLHSGKKAYHYCSDFSKEEF